MSEPAGYCAYCGAPLEVGDRFCPSCGRACHAPAPSPASVAAPGADTGRLADVALWALAWAAGALLHSLLRGGGPYALVPALCWLVGGLVAGSGLPRLATPVNAVGAYPHPPVAAVALLGATTLGWAALLGLGALLDDVLGAVLYSYLALGLVRAGVFALVAGAAGGWLAGRLARAPGGPEALPRRGRAALAGGTGALLAQLLWLASTFL